MTLQEALRLLETQYEALKAKNERGERLLPSDLPRIEGAPLIPEEERRRIYEKQEGFEFHGMFSERLATIFDEFHGSAVWVPHSCREYLSFSDFNKKLEDAYWGASVVGDILLTGTSPRDSHNSGMGGFLARAKELPLWFPWVHMVFSYRELYDGNREVGVRYAKKRFIKPKLAVVNKLLSKQPGDIQENLKDVMNKLWLYMAWTQRT